LIHHSNSLNQLTNRSRGLLKILVPMVRFRLWAPLLISALRSKCSDPFDLCCKYRRQWYQSILYE